MYNKRAFYKTMHPGRNSEYRCGVGSNKRDWMTRFPSAFNHPPANVRELDDKYELYLFAPGYEKSDFIIALIDNRLSISVKEKEEVDQNWRRKEYSQGEFVRQFELSEKVNKEDIIAKYENGVLILSLPKLEEFETSRQEIKVD